MDFAEITTMLGTLLGILTPLGGVGIFMYRKQNRQLKDAEVENAKLQTQNSQWQIFKDQYEAVSHMNQELIERNERLVKINAEKEDRYAEDLREKEDRFKDQTTVLRGVQRELVEALEREKEHVRKEARLEKERDHFKEWRCIKPWRDCMERKPEQEIKHDHYTPLDSECSGSCSDCKINTSSTDHDNN